MNEVTVNMDNLTKEEREQFLALAEKANKPFGAWKPVKGEYYYSTSLGGISCETMWIGDSLDEACYARGRAFQTEQQAEFFYKQERILTQYKRLAEESWAGEKIDWNDVSQTKWRIHLNSGAINYSTVFSCKSQGCVYFKSIESLKNAIKAIGEENIIKYLF